MKRSIVLLIIGLHFITVTRQESYIGVYSPAARKCSPKHVDMRLRIMELYTDINELCGFTTTTTTSTTTSTTTTSTTTSTTTTSTTTTTTTTSTAPCSMPPALVTLFQLYSAAKNYHFYVTTMAEVTTATAMTPMGGYVVQASPGRVTNALTCPCGTPLSAIYRLVNTVSNDHFYTESQTEAAGAVSMFGYTQEGIKFYCSPTKGLCGATLPLLRFRSGSDHIYITDPSQAMLGWIFERIMCYVWP